MSMARAHGTSSDAAARRVLGGAVAALLVAAVSGALTVSPGSHPVASVQLLVASADHTLAAGGARVALTVSTTTTTGGTSRTIGETGQGVVDTRGRTGHVLETVAGVGTIEAVNVGTTAYIRLPAPLSAQLRIPTPWVSLDLSSLVQSVQALVGSTGTYDPLAGLRLLSGSGLARSVTEVGQDQIRGVSATHYHVVLDPDRLFSLIMSSSLFEGVDLSALKMTDAALDVWIDDSDLVRRDSTSAKLSVTLPGRPAAQTMTTTTEDLYDYGIAVHVTAPPASQVTPEPNLLAIFGRR